MDILIFFGRFGLPDFGCEGCKQHNCSSKSCHKKYVLKKKLMEKIKDKRAMFVQNGSR